MGSKKILILLVVLVVIIGFAILVGAGLLYLLHSPAEMTRSSVLEVPLIGSLGEIPASDPFSKLFQAGATNLWDLRRALRAAAADSRITALYLEIFPLTCSWAQVEELRDYILEFQLSGKPVQAFLAVDLVTEKELYLAAAADRISMNPTSGFLVDGLMAEVVFMKRTMDKIGVKPQFIQFKEYKSAETYTRQRLTPEIREMLTDVLRDLQGRMLETIAQDRQVELESLKELNQRGLFTASVGFEAGLVDALEYEHEVLTRMEELSAGEDYNGVRLADYLERVSASYPAGKAKVAFVGATGTIIAGRSDAFANFLGAISLSEILRRIREDSSIDAVLLRVDSPGGSAVGSDMIWEEVRRLEESGKPVVVSMAGVAGSGGYYISMPAHRLVAQPSTITGSIGVLFGKFDFSGLYDWLGMDIDRIKLSPNSDMFSLTASLTPEQEQQVRNWMQQTYDTFVRKAAEGRDQEFENLEPKARGRIYTGTQALEAGLIDRLGGVSVALEEIREALGLEESAPIRLELYPRPKTLWETLSSGDIFAVREASARLNSLRESLFRLERPSVWLLAPEIQVQ